MNSALRRMGFTQEEMTAHGFRSSASTILNERGYNGDVIEAALGHQGDDEIRRIYNRGKYWAQRVTLMNDWADFIELFASDRNSETQGAVIQDKASGADANCRRQL